MIIIKYNGGLGNQMFQYANQVALQNNYKDQLIKADLSHYMLWNEHNGFELERVFDIKLNQADYKEIRSLTNSFIASKWVELLPNFVKYALAYKFNHFYRKINDLVKPSKRKSDIGDSLYNEYNSQVESLQDGSWYLHGVWLNTKYFSKYKNNLLEVFRLECDLDESDMQILEELRNGKAIAVHVRGGDFNNQYYNLCDENYYVSAISKVGKDKPVYIFTDDIAFAKKKILGITILGFISHDITESIKDMYMMSLSKYIILSNSTFAFWGGYLNTIKEKVVAPKFARYDGNEYWSFPTEDDWEVIDNRKVIRDL